MAFYALSLIQILFQAFEIFKFIIYSGFLMLYKIFKEITQLSIL